mmetsp:Transcript_15867/g.24423  ORF Transcript_15867/g.24423 Transcript_15867/m.24423 type:complete len:244 (-) Transcript_15867:34-765(-)
MAQKVAVKGGAAVAAVVLEVVPQIHERLQMARGYLPESIAEDDYKSKNEKNLVDHIETATDWMQYAANISDCLNDSNVSDSSNPGIQKAMEMTKEAVVSARDKVCEKAREYYHEHGHHDVIVPGLAIAFASNEHAQVPAEEQQKEELEQKIEFDFEPGSILHQRVEDKGSKDIIHMNPENEHAHQIEGMRVPAKALKAGAQKLQNEKEKENDAAENLRELYKLFVFLATAVVSIFIGVRKVSR